MASNTGRLEHAGGVAAPLPTTTDPNTVKQVQEWAKKLIDLSRRNRLLYFREYKRTNLAFRDPAPDAIATRLLDDKSWLFYRPPEIPKALPGVQQQVTPLEVVLTRQPPGDRELVTTQRDPVEIDRSLEAIERKARAEFEDRGTHVLHLAWGLAKWRDPRGDDLVAPLLLIPVTLKRSSVRDRFELEPVTDDDPVVNPALRVKLEGDYGDEFPDLDIAESSLEEIEAAVREKLPPAGTIEAYAGLGLFSFAKEAIYRDLVDNADIVAQHALIRTIAKETAAPEIDGSLVAVPSEDQLDSVQAPADSLIVVDADSSQRQAIEAARRGLSFVLVGPPGTGKSQTIANVIADFVGRGKSVLFVSQKIAALEVVAERLERAELRELVLELHSAKASRRAVAGSLVDALDHRIESRHDGFAPVAGRVHRRVSDLNGYVSALHEIREPLHRSAFDVLSELATLHEVPAIEGAPVDAAAASGAELESLLAVVGRLRDNWAPVLEGTAFPWRDATVDGQTDSKRALVAENLGKVRAAVNQAEMFDEAASAFFERVPARGQEDRRRLVALGRLARERKPGPIEWLTRDDLGPYGSLLARWRNASGVHATLISQLEATHGSRWREMAPGLDSTMRELDTRLEEIATPPNLAFLVANRVALASAARSTMTRLATCQATLSALSTLLGFGRREGSIAAARDAVAVARATQTIARPPLEWLVRSRLDAVKAFIAAHGDEYMTEQTTSARLAAKYDVSLLSLDLDALSERMGRWYGRWWNLLRPQHRADRGAIASASTSHVIPDTVIDDLQQARTVRYLRGVLASIDVEARSLLGPYAQSLATNVGAVRVAIEAADTVLTKAPAGSDWTRLAQLAGYGLGPDPAVDHAADDLAAAIDAFESSLAALIAPSGKGISELAALPFGALEAWLGDFALTLDELTQLIAQIDRSRSRAITSIDEVRSETCARARIDEGERILSNEEPILLAALHDSFRGFDSDWAGLSEGLEWARSMRGLYGERCLPETVARCIEAGESDHFDWDAHERALDELDSAAVSCAGLFDEGRRAETLATVLGPAVDAKAFVDSLLLRLPALATWHAYRSTRSALSKLGWQDFVDVATERLVRTVDLEACAKRAWLEAWFASLAGADEQLGKFSRDEHERAVLEYRNADRQLIELGRERVLKSYGDRKPAPLGIIAGEQSVVRKEATKKKKHWPVRRLLGAIPTLLPQLKPCLMMSPLSVSHFLTPDVRFDVVVFDEASQVPPEDAVNCIYRGSQLIVAGDPNQLPPSDFFQLAASADADADIEDELGDFESVLDVCRSVGLHSVPLRWHYRSRHDGLIAFSNHYIYRDSLITFPAPVQRADGLGVKFVYVPDAVFERGKGASNPIEARRVMDVVEEIVRTEPGQTIGVVAFSVAQQQAIQDELERRFRVDPALERRLGDGRLDGFFVKNLETVQGDERDIVVFSIGYGRDENGRIYHNFGPLNRKGGARRLNVAVSRARKRVVVVSSIRAADLKLDEVDVRSGDLPDGAKLLRAYLRYAETGQLDGDSRASSGRDLGALEEDVAAVIEGLGYDVVRRVGTSQYRVDLGVLSKVHPGRICLGIECDGDVYQSAKTARDRDRLRAEVLGGLGWQLHRVWAQDWYFRRAENIERLQAAIDAAERDTERPRQLPISGITPSFADFNGRERRRTELQTVDLREARDAVQLPWTRAYEPTSGLKYTRTWMEFHDYGLLEAHMRNVVLVAQQEGPVHQKVVTTRLTHAFGLSRAGSRIADAVEAAILQAESRRLIKRRGAFVWQAGKEDLDFVRVSVPGNPETERTIELIPPEEVELALMRTAESAGSIANDDLKVVAARALGFDRTGGKIDEAFDVRIRALRAGKRLEVTGEGTVRLGPAAKLPHIEREDDKLRVGGWAEHPTLGVGRILDISGTVVTIELKGIRRQIETKVMPLRAVSSPQ